MKEIPNNPMPSAALLLLLLLGLAMGCKAGNDGGSNAESAAVSSSAATETTTSGSDPSSSTSDVGDLSARCDLIKSSISDAGFGDSVSVSCADGYANIVSSAYPDHDLMNGITGTNEQIPVPAPNHSVPIPLAPALAANLTTIDAALAVAVNGVPIYDYSAAGTLDTSRYDPGIDTKVLGQLDNCGGHAGRGDDYHYHAAPSCMIEEMDNQGDAAIIGWGFDGFPIYGNNNPDGSIIVSGELDTCNGKTDEFFCYRYHTSEAPPYILKCLMGKVDQTLLPRIAPLTEANGRGGKESGAPPAGGVGNLSHSVDGENVHTMSYTYEGQDYYIKYWPSGKANCYHFEMKTVSGQGAVETGDYCR